jgi:capsid protein
MTDDEIQALVSDWARTFDVKLTATQHMGLQLALRDSARPAPCLHVRLLNDTCEDCGAKFLFI